jgi:EAL domain-containing protein (putative c-di-GMP-specific phosphodiesterase class I)
MENQEHQSAGAPAVLCSGIITPRAYVADAEPDMRTFLAESLQELGFIVGECAELGELAAALDSRRPALVVIGSSTGGIEACEMVELLAGRKFDGKVLVLGPRVSPMVAAVRELGESLDLRMLPLLPTPFGAADVRDCVAPLIDAPPTSSESTARGHEADWLELWYQPKVDTRTLAVAGAEARMRVRHPSRGFVASDDGEFHLDALADVVIARAVEDWRRFAAAHGHVEIAINLPVAVFRDLAALDDLCRRMPDHPAFEGLMIELDAAEAARDLDLVKDISRRLRHHNIAIAIDGVGADWHALARVHDFPFVELKVDRQFVAGCATDRAKQATCRRIVDLADAVGARTVAAGVASRADFIAVRELGFQLAQGFPHGEPMTAQTFMQSVLGGREPRG